MDKMKKKKEELTERIAILRRNVEGVKASAEAIEDNFNQQRDHDQLFRVIVGSLQDAVFLTLENGDFSWLSPNSSRHFSCSTHELWEKKNIFSLLKIPPENLFDAGELLERGEIKNLEIEYRGNGGDIRYFSIDIKRVDIHDGVYLFIFRDMTAAKSMEMLLRETDQNLAEMIYIASHDLQAPLISLEGYASELLESYGDKLDEKGVYCLNRLKVNASRMHHLVVGLLEISRLKTRPYPYETFDPAVMAMDIVSELRLSLCKTDTVIKIGQLPVLRGDRQRLEGVFRRLLANAMLYGAKNITIGYAQKTWFISDDGVGIPQEQTENVFTPGVRLKQVEAEGIGMGLTYCRKVIQKHGGKIWIESGGIHPGATVFFKIPT